MSVCQGKVVAQDSSYTGQSYNPVESSQDATMKNKGIWTGSVYRLLRVNLTTRKESFRVGASLHSVNSSCPFLIDFIDQASVKRFYLRCLGLSNHLSSEDKITITQTQKGNKHCRCVNTIISLALYICLTHLHSADDLLCYFKV